jgi:phosphoenolpyruvate carboxylase
VFSWTQARFYLTGWYGAGSGLAALSETDLDVLREQVRTVPFLRYLITNIETSLASSDLEVMREYSLLVEDVELRECIWERIESEWHRTQRNLSRVLGTEFARHRPRLGRTLALRVGPLRTLHRQQITLLRQWRSLNKSGDTEGAQARLPELLLTINAIASGLRTTG